MSFEKVPLAAKAVALIAIQSGGSQVAVSHTVGISDGYASKIFGFLVKERVLSINLGSKNPKTYIAGENFKILDEMITDDERNNILRKLSSECGVHGGNLSSPVRADIHSIGAKAKVDVVGKIASLDVTLDPMAPTIKRETRPFLRASIEGFDGGPQYYGKVALPDGRTFSVRWNRPEGTDGWMFVWLGEKQLTLKELEGLDRAGEEALIAQARDALNFISKYGGWQFGHVEMWKGSNPHPVMRGGEWEAVRASFPDKFSVEVPGMCADSSPPAPDGKPQLEPRPHNGMGANQRAVAITRALGTLPETTEKANQHDDELAGLRAEMSQVKASLRDILESMQIVEMIEIRRTQSEAAEVRNG